MPASTMRIVIIIIILRERFLSRGCCLCGQRRAWCGILALRERVRSDAWPLCPWVLSRCEEHELVQSEALSTSLDDSCSCGFGESESGDGQLGHFEESNVVSDGADNDGDALGLGAEVLHEA
ncbi:hypothetical protein FGO68_gene6832 [Halteria grandinella]|uniref:Secreted protein n=1 Tax=Halteria grandinella TaxID=5974 RepID=A0A8J8T821_HALGN|nr:hypothetical protein FGO68_gene6832 [Halteria grandinella]